MLMNKISIYFRKRKSKLKKWFIKYFPQYLKKEAHPLKPIVTRGKSKKHMMSITGRIIESLSYSMLVLITTVVIVSSAMYYQNQIWLDNQGNIVKRDFFDCLYFSIVTFTSLGYGDIAPAGYSRLIASLEVFSGLFLVAILVGKIASERQTAWVQLIYTSINQKRLTQYKKSLIKKIEELRVAIESRDENILDSEVQNIFPFIAGIKNYLLFNSNQGNLAYFGNKSSLRKLYLSIFNLQTILIKIYRYEKLGTQSNEEIEKTLVKIYVIAAHMQRFHKKHTRVLPVIQRILNNHDFFLSVYKEVQNQLDGHNRSTRRMSEDLINKVFAKLPPKPWEKGVHKKIASELNISNSLCTSCIDELTNCGRIN